MSNKCEMPVIKKKKFFFPPFLEWNAPFVGKILSEWRFSGRNWKTTRRKQKIKWHTFEISVNTLMFCNLGRFWQHRTTWNQYCFHNLWEKSVFQSRMDFIPFTISYLFCQIYLYFILKLYTMSSYLKGKPTESYLWKL